MTAFSLTGTKPDVWQQFASAALTGLVLEARYRGVNRPDVDLLAHEAACLADAMTSEYQLRLTRMHDAETDFDDD